MFLRSFYHDHEESAFAEMSLPLEVLHTRIVVAKSPFHSPTPKCDPGGFKPNLRIRHKLLGMEHLTIEQQIRSEIYVAFELLGADRELLGTIGSWGDTLDDREILRLLKEWNGDGARREKLASNWF